MEQNTRNYAKYLQKHQPTSQEEENDQNKTGNGHKRHPGTKKTQHHSKVKRHNPSNIINLSNHVLSTIEKTILSEGLHFIPTPYKEHPVKMLQDYLHLTEN